MLAFGISWGSVLLAAAPSGFPAAGEDVARLLPAVFSVMLLGPAIAGLGLTWVLEGGRGLRDLLGRFGRWRVGGWHASALVSPAVLLLLGALGLLVPHFVPRLVSAPDRGQLVVLALVFGLGAGFLEEMGWSGFALPRMQARSGWLAAGLQLGLVWAVWHLLASYWGAGEAWGQLFAAQFVLWCIASFTAFRVLMSWVYVHTRSLLAMQLMHASFTGGQALLEPELTPGVASLAWYAAFAVALWIAVTLVARRSRRRLVTGTESLPPSAPRTVTVPARA